MHKYSAALLGSAFLAGAAAGFLGSVFLAGVAEGFFLGSVLLVSATQIDAFQILMVLSLLPLAICLPSGLKQTLRTLSPCPLRVDSHSNVPADPADQILTVLSA